MPKLQILQLDAGPYLALPDARPPTLGVDVSDLLAFIAVLDSLPLADWTDGPDWLGGLRCAPHAAFETWAHVQLNEAMDELTGDLPDRLSQALTTESLAGQHGTYTVTNMLGRVSNRLSSVLRYRLLALAARRGLPTILMGGLTTKGLAALLGREAKPGWYQTTLPRHLHRNEATIGAARRVLDWVGLRAEVVVQVTDGPALHVVDERYRLNATAAPLPHPLTLSVLCPTTPTTTPVPSAGMSTSMVSVEADASPNPPPAPPASVSDGSSMQPKTTPFAAPTVLLLPEHATPPPTVKADPTGGFHAGDEVLVEREAEDEWSGVLRRYEGEGFWRVDDGQPTGPGSLSVHFSDMRLAQKLDDLTRRSLLNAEPEPPRHEGAPFEPKERVCWWELLATGGYEVRKGVVCKEQTNISTVRVELDRAYRTFRMSDFEAVEEEKLWLDGQTPLPKPELSTDEMACPRCGHLEWCECDDEAEAAFVAP